MYLKYRKNFFSQNGEDGIIEKIINELNLNKKLFVCEFGAWDGKFLSNTFHLVKKFKAVALMIEGDKDRFINLINTSKKNPTIIPINKFVGVNGEDSLDNILFNNNFPKNFDLLSIDVDSNDLEIWENLINYKPKIVVIEINSSLLPGIKQRHNPKKNMIGNSFTSTLEVAKLKGYSLLAHTGNLIFIRNDLLKYINLNNELLKYPNKLFINDFINLKNENKNILIKILKLFIPKFIKRRINDNFKYNFLNFFNKK